MKIGFYLTNESVGDADLSNPEKGNPGIGGTEFLTVSLPYYFNKYVNKHIESTLYANRLENLPETVAVDRADSATAALEKADQANLDFLVWRPTEDEEGKELVRNVDSHDVQLVCWMHNIMSAKFLHRIDKKEQLAGFVFVGQEQLDIFRDCRIFNSSTFIFNGFDTTYYEPAQVNTENKTVTYLGSLTPVKGFHVLAKLWPAIKNEVPDAELRVIGTGQLYDRRKQLGQWEIAAESYEQEFRPYLSDSTGEPVDSVTFEGLIDTEKKIDLLQNSTVGVANPNGGTANCPGSAIEFQAAGTPVVSIAYRGMFDTVQDGKTGYLGKNEAEIKEGIVSLLKDQERAIRMGENGIRFINHRFGYEHVCGQWLETFRRLKANEPLPNYPLKNKYHNYKYAREALRISKGILPFAEYLPCVKRSKEILSSVNSATSVLLKSTSDD